MDRRMPNDIFNDEKNMAQDLLLIYPSMKKIRYIYRRFQLSNWCCYYTERKTSSIFFAQIQPSVVPVHYYRKRTRSYSRNSEDLSASAIRSGNQNFNPPQASNLPFNRIRTWSYLEAEVDYRRFLGGTSIRSRRKQYCCRRSLKTRYRGGDARGERGSVCVGRTLVEPTCLRRKQMHNRLRSHQGGAGNRLSLKHNAERCKERSEIQNFGLNLWKMVLV